MKVWFLALALLVYFGRYACDDDDDDPDGISPATTKKITDFIEAATKAADALKEKRDALKETGKVISPLINRIGKLAPFLGVAGGFLTVVLAFIPQEDSDDLKHMKKEFAKVNKKLDNIAYKLGDIETLITYEAQRSSFIRVEHNVLIGFEKLSAFYDELLETPCSNINECKYKKTKISSRYLDEFIKVGFSLEQILKGSITTAVFGEPLLDLVKTRFKCDVGKLTEFMENIIRVAAKGQQVVLATEKLIGSKISIAHSRKKYMKSIYDLRAFYYIKKNECFENLKTYYSKDIKDKKYQSDSLDNNAANKALSEALEKKYPWLKWNVHSYKSTRDRSYAVKVIDGNFSSPPDNKGRVIIATSVDPNGIYTEGRMKDVDDAVITGLKGDNGVVYECILKKKKCIEAIEKGMEIKNILVKDYIQSISVMEEDVKPTIRSSKRDYLYIDEIYPIKTTQLSKVKDNLPMTKNVRVVIMLKSVEMGTTECTKDCSSSHSECKRLPLSKSMECQCKANYDGEECKDRAEIDLKESSLNKLLSTTYKIPTLFEMYHNVEHLKDKTITGMGRVDNDISKFTLSLDKYYLQTQKKLSQNFEWTGISVAYKNTIKDIIFYSKQFDIEARKKKVASYVLKEGHIQSWMDDLNQLFLGSTSLLPVLHNDKPFMIMLMNEYSATACSSDYKQLIDDGYEEFKKLQLKAYWLWVGALAVENKNVDIATEILDGNVNEQEKKYKEMTCNYEILNSVNVKCTNNRYIHPTMTIKNTCVANYYAEGPIDTKCNDPVKSRCLPCLCDGTGSNTQGCYDQTGKCKCKTVAYHESKEIKYAQYYGDKCENLDCQWGLWEPYTECPICDYGGTQSRVRIIDINQYGEGENCPDSGSSQKKDCLFKSCCSNQFHCSNQKKCISAGFKCDYGDECGDMQDEDDEMCQEECEWKYSTLTHYNYGKEENLHKQETLCRDKNWAMQSFQLEKYTKSPDHVDPQLRYKFRCCKLNNDFPLKVKKIEPDLKKKMKCPDKSYINGFGYKKNPRLETYSMYYNCNDMIDPNFLAKSSCTKTFTEWDDYLTDSSDYLQYYTRHFVDCQTLGTRWFLNNFELEFKKSTKQMRYKYQCCRMNA